MRNILNLCEKNKNKILKTSLNNYIESLKKKQ